MQLKSLLFASIFKNADYHNEDATPGEIITMVPISDAVDSVLSFEDEIEDIQSSIEQIEDEMDSLDDLQEEIDGGDYSAT